MEVAVRPLDGAVRLPVGRGPGRWLQVTSRYRLCCRSNRLGQHAASRRSSHTATTFPACARQALNDDPERFLDTNTNSSGSTLKPQT